MEAQTVHINITLHTTVLEESHALIKMQQHNDEGHKASALAQALGNRDRRAGTACPCAERTCGGYSAAQLNGTI
jgi:hypothetical protein